MNNPNYATYGCFKYTSTVTSEDDFKLGDIVINSEKQIGIVIQIHSKNEVRTDMFGNACSDEIRLATDSEIELDGRLSENSTSSWIM